MLPRWPRKFWLSLFFMSVVAMSRAQAAEDAPVRYHFGDDPRWAAPALDDTAWPVADNRGWPVPPFYSDGFVWIRLRIAVPPALPGPLAIRDTNRSSLGTDVSTVEAHEIFVNGRLVSRRGSLPPHPIAVLPARDATFALSPGLVQPGTIAIVALRAWYPPFARRAGTLVNEPFAIDEKRNLDLAASAERASTLLAGGPDLTLNLLITLMGIALLIFWRSAGGRELLLCAAMLITFPLFGAFVGLSELGFVRLHWRIDSLVWALLRTTSMLVTIEFIWTVHEFGRRGIKRIAQFLALFRNALPLIAQFAFVPLAMVHFSLLAMRPVSNLFDVLMLGANLWALFTRKRNRLIAGALALVPLASLAGWFGWLGEIRLGPFHFDSFNVAYFITALALFITLGQRARRAWRSRDELRFELEAAREVQQKLVAPAEDVPGFKIESAYIPATQVGGDFFRVVAEGGNGVLIVIGDVSGKGLRAAMTVASVVGALRTIHPVSPAWILGALNSGLVGNLTGGFVTCCAARVTPAGALIIANAGHLSPYRNGVELELAAGLPLGLDPGAEYAETQFQLEPSESLTFVSDGIVEARNSAGELFGFERTVKISLLSASSIAQAAVAFGQEDDITVLKMTWLAPQASPGSRNSPVTSASADN